MDEACSAPETVRAALTVEEAVERKPLYKVAKPLDCKVEEANTPPEIVSILPMVEELDEKTLLAAKSEEEAFRFPLTFKLEAMLEDAEEIKPPVNVLAPITVKVPPTCTLFPIVVAARTDANGKKVNKKSKKRNFSLRFIDLI